MTESLAAVAKVLIGIAVLVWLLIEVVSRGLDKAGLKARPWAQLVLHLLPMVLGAAVCSVDGVFTELIKFAGYAPRNPPSHGVAAFLGLLGGAGAVFFHDKIKVVVGLWSARLPGPPDVPPPVQ